MVLELIFDFGLWLFDLIFSTMPTLEPTLYSLTSTFSDIISFGIWVIGDDMWQFILTYIATWMTFKISWGLVLFIYKLIPVI